MNRNQLDNLINNFKHSIEYLEELRIKSFYKGFSNLNKQVSLNETLATYTKNDLDDIRKDLHISGISSLNKQKLAEALEGNIKGLLSEILKKFTDIEYKLVKNMVKHKGILKYKEELFKGFSYLKRFGIIGCFKDNNDQNYIFIPEDILEGINSLINDITIVGAIKQNEKVNMLLRGLLFYYGAIPSHKTYDMITNYIKKDLGMVNIFNIIYESSIKDNEVNFHKDYWYLEDIRSIDELISQHKMKSNLDYFSLTEKQVIEASKVDFVEWNEYDRKLINYLCDNFEVSKQQVMGYIEGIKFNFKIGYDFNEILKEFLSSFEMEDLEQLNQVAEIFTSVYNNSIQWYLKGHSPTQVRNAEKSQLQSVPDNTKQALNTKIGRNDPCPCGSGKKYKNCCLK
ncbi:SEC-C metal-binding domain-containing protein [Clostridium sp. CF012]|uniref:SEC-C metal-binding domain-containing protein n=1 Tax=Clostridium sp. CF012 TaxID=2843319 RepID=UPI001C0BAF0D|nr:SEC-C metal-binding domain-containing protein [Clostridium sp. CF012]MBU3145233.1 SEC-C domain-containing protein [Clostridium sp. CF012]